MGQGRPQGVHAVAAIQRVAQPRDPLVRPKTPFPEPNLHPVDLQQAPHHLGELHPPGQILDGAAGDDQPPRRPVDLTEPGVGDVDAFQATLALVFHAFRAPLLIKWLKIDSTINI